MEQVYIVTESDGGTRDCLYRYGNFCYTDTLSLSPVHSTAHVPRLLRELQSVQSKMKFISEYDNLAPDSDEGTQLAKLDLAMNFISKQLLDEDSLIMDAIEDNNWVDSENAEVYFEFEMHPSYECHTADVIIAKRYHHSVMMTVIFFESKFLVALSDASKEQHLVDSKLPAVHGRKRGFNVAAFDHPWFAKLSLWEAADEDDSSDSSSSDDDDAPAATATASRPSTVDVSGEGYVQTYIVKKPKALASGSTARDVFFRFGNWCYAGQVDLGVPSLNLGDVPEVLPALQRQQSLLSFAHETAHVPTTSPYAPLLTEMARIMEFFEEQIMASEAKLSKMAEIGVTSWIEEDWGAAFFELSCTPGSVFDDVELIAAKRYARGIILHTVLFDGSLYAVLADADDDQPLLDVAFPDVTARCRGFQIKNYSKAPTKGLTPRRLSVWEGRRRGAVGVGWGTAAALAAGGAARPKDGSVTAGTDLRHTKTREATGIAAAAAARARKRASGGGKDADEDAEGGKDDDTPAVSAAAGGKDADDDEEEGKDGGAASSSGPKSPVKQSYGVRAPHHLPPMGASGRLRKLAPVGSGGPAPWDSGGRPVLGKSVLGK